MDNRLLYLDCVEYVEDHEVKFSNSNEKMDNTFPSTIEFNYDKNIFNVREGSNCSVNVEYEVNGTGFGWNTCTTFDEFKNRFHDFLSLSSTITKTQPISQKLLPSMIICGETSRLSESVMKKLRSSKSCKIVSEGGGDITIFQIGFGSEAYEIWKEHHLPGGKEPDALDDSGPVYIISPAFVEGAILPPMEAVGDIHQAVTKALVTYSALRKADFANGTLPVIPADFVAYPRLGFKFHHSTIAAYKVLERIQTGEGLPDIMALPAGTNIVQLNVLYSNCALSILLVKSCV